MSDYCTLFSQTFDGLLFSCLTITDVTWYVHHKFPVSFLLYITTEKNLTKSLMLTVLRMFLSQNNNSCTLCVPMFSLVVQIYLCTSQLKAPPFGSRGRVGYNRGIKSLLNNKPSLRVVHLTDFDFGFPPHLGPRSREKLGTTFSYGASKDGRVFKKSVYGPHDSCSSHGKDCLAFIA